MKICGIDASTTASSISLIKDGKYADHKLFTRNKNEDTEDRIKGMMKDLGNAILGYSPDIVFIENTWNLNNLETTKKLTRIIGAVEYVCCINNIAFNMVQPSEWRKAVGIKMGKKKRAELKQEAIDAIKEKLNMELTDDEAEAILLGFAGTNIMNELIN